MNELIFDDVTRSRIRAGRLAGALAEALGLPVAVDVEQQRGRVERVTVTRLDGQPFSAEQAITARLLLDTHDPDRPSREEQEIARREAARVCLEAADLTGIVRAVEEASSVPALRQALMQLAEVVQHHLVLAGVQPPFAEEKPNA